MKYLKKPIVIEAVRWVGDNFNEVRDFCPEARFLDDSKGNGYFIISTKEGKMFCSVGDYIIKGIFGEFYPCKPDIFEKIMGLDAKKLSITSCPYKTEELKNIPLGMVNCPVCLNMVIAGLRHPTDEEVIETGGLPYRKACPFCGSNDVHVLFLQDNINQVGCSDCGARGPTSTVGKYKNDKFHNSHFNAQHRAVIAWNNQ